MDQKLVSHVSDTARWVATYRAWETARPDALFRDPYAERLAGERGAAIARLMPKQARSGWPLIVRTKLIDDLILQSITEGCDRVINLAAGLDTRPYRMKLPDNLTWIEVDHARVIEEKERVLGTERPACNLQRRPADLSDPAARASVLDEATGGSQRTLVISEGLVIYLDEDVVRALATDLLSRPAIRWWLLDLASPELRQMMMKTMGEQLASAPLKFAPPNGVAYFEALGWAVQDVSSFMRAAVKYRRLPWFLRPFGLLPEPNPRQLKNARWSAVVRLAHAR
jgi:methyltransferase (TIGR00027 family)